MSVIVNKNDFHKNNSIQSFVGIPKQSKMKNCFNNMTNDTFLLKNKVKRNKSKKNFISNFWSDLKNLIGLKSSSKNNEQLIKSSDITKESYNSSKTIATHSPKLSKNISFSGSYRFQESGYGHGEYSFDDELSCRIYEDGAFAEVSEFPNGIYLAFDDGTNVFEHNNGDVEVDGALVYKAEIESEPVEKPQTILKEFKTLPTEPVRLVTKKDGKDCTVVIMPSAFKKMPLDKFNAYIEAAQRGFKTSGTGIKGTTRSCIFEIRTSPNGLYGDTRIMGYFDKNTGEYVFERYCNHKGADAYIYSKKL